MRHRSDTALLLLPQMGKSAANDAWRRKKFIDKWEKEGKVFVLRPEIEPVARLERDTQKLENFYQHGYDLMEEKFEEMKWFLNR